MASTMASMMTSTMEPHSDDSHFDYNRFMRMLRENYYIELSASSSYETRFASTAKRSTFSDKGPVKFCKKTKLNCLDRTPLHLLSRIG